MTNFEVREFGYVAETLEVEAITDFGDDEQAAWDYAGGLAKKGIYAEVHTQSTYEGCNM